MENFMSTSILIGIIVIVLLSTIVIINDDKAVYHLPIQIIRIFNEELASFIEVTRKYQNADFLKPEIIKTELKNVAAFKNFNKDVFMTNNIDRIDFEALNSIYTSKQYDDYIHSLTRFSQSTSRRVRKLSVDPKDKVIIINYSYTSPKGRSHYENSVIYNYNELNKLRDTVYTQNKLKNKHKTFAEIERSKMSTKLRYEIIKRDGGKCVVCGRSVADGVKLHVDHIVPIAKGGKTEPNNLRTLCQDCNLGKSDNYDPEYNYIKKT